MRSSLGISLGTANLVTVVDGRPTPWPAAVTVRPGLTVTGFVDRVGDPVPMLAADGSAHRADRLAAAAIEAATRRAAPRRRPDVAAVAVPAHWSGAAVAALRAQAPHLRVVSDATAALTAVAAGPGLPTRGVVVLCDLGATGTNITLADAGNALAVIGQTVRCDEFSGDLVDQALLRHVVDGLDADPAGTSAVASLIDLRAECRAAKERLSDSTATALAGPHSTIRVTRAELQSVIAGPLDRLIVALLDLLHRHRIAPAHLAAVVTVGAGACIPLVTQRLSEALRCPVITTPQAQAAAAIGAELIAVRGVAHEAPTMLAPAATPLAWSAEEDADDADYDEAATEFALPRADVARPEVHFDHETSSQERAHSRMRRSPVWLAGAACVAAVAVAGVVLTAEIARGDGTVATGVSDISTPVATHALEPAAQPAAPPPQADPVTQTVVAAAPAPQPAVAPAPAVPTPQQQVVAKQAAPQPAPAPAAPAPAPAAPAPPPAPVWPRIPLPQFTFPAPTPKPSPTPAPNPSPTPEPSPSPTAEPEPSPSSSPSPEPSATATPEPSTSAEPSPAPECVPTPETTC